MSGLFNPQGDQQGGLFGGLGRRRLPESAPQRDATPAPREVPQDGNPFPNLVRDREQLSRLWTHIAQVLSDNIRQQSMGEEEPQQGLPRMGGGTQDAWERFREVERSQGVDPITDQGPRRIVSDDGYVYSDEEIPLFEQSGMPQGDTLAPEFRIGDNQIAEFALGAGFDPEAAVIAVAIALSESIGSTAAVGDTEHVDDEYGTSLGLWQIRSMWSPPSSGRDRIRDHTRLFDPAFNAEAAYVLSGGGVRWNDWTEYNNGNYERYLGRARQAVEDAMAAQAEGVR